MIFMVALIKGRVEGPTNLDRVVAKGADAKSRDWVDAMMTDIHESTKAATEGMKYALRTQTPKSRFPHASDPPARRKSGDFMRGAKMKVLRNSRKQGQYRAQIGWVDDNYPDYFFYQEKGFRHTGGKPIEGVMALERAKQVFKNEMDARGYRS